MVRGRRQDPTAQPSRQLEISRAFRERRAKDVQNMRDQLAALQEEAQRLRHENGALKEENYHLVSRLRASGSGSAACGRCDELRSELECIKFQARSIASSGGCCSSTPTTAATAANKVSCGRPTAQATSPPAPHAVRHPSPPVQPPHLSVTSSRSLSSLSPSSSSSPSSFAPPYTPHTSIKSFSSALPPSDMRYHPPHPHSLPSTEAPPAVLRLWEDSVRESGGDPNKCCAGFFECDQQGQIIVEMPGRVT